MKHFSVLLFLFLLVASCKEGQNIHLTEISGKQIPISDTIPSNETISAFIQPYKEHIDQKMNAVLSYSLRDLNKEDGELNTAIGNMMADAVMKMANPVFKKRTGNSIDMVLLNFGGIRSSIPRGDVTTRSAFQLMPFENEVVVAELSGTTTRKMVQFLIDSGSAHPVSGIEIVINDKNNLKKALIQGKPISDTATYFIATNDYLFQGGDDMVFFSEAENLTETNYKIRNLLIDYFKELDTLTPVEDNRFIRIK